MWKGRNLWITESLPDISILPLTARVLGVTVDELLNGEHSAEKEAVPTSSASVDNKERPLAIHHASRIAPFLSRNALDSMIEQVEGEVHWSNVMALAPFLGHATLEKLVEKVNDGKPELGKLTGIAPFLSKETLGRLARQMADESVVPEQILALSPFLDQFDLIMLIESRGVNSFRPEHLASLAPFIPQAMLERFALGYKQNAHIPQSELYYVKEEWKEGNETFYFELDSEGTVTRQINQHEQHTSASNRPDFCLSDTPIQFNQDKQIPKSDFESMWSLANNPLMNEWLQLKEALAVNTMLEGTIEVIYPQGIIVSFGGNGYGIADYEACLDGVGAGMIYKGNIIVGKVSGFDDVNLWVIMKDAVVNGAEGMRGKDAK